MRGEVACSEEKERSRLPLGGGEREEMVDSVALEGGGGVGGKRGGGVGCGEGGEQGGKRGGREGGDKGERERVRKLGRTGIERRGGVRRFSSAESVCKFARHCRTSTQALHPSDNETEGRQSSLHPCDARGWHHAGSPLPTSAWDRRHSNKGIAAVTATDWLTALCLKDDTFSRLPRHRPQPH